MRYKLRLLTVGALLVIASFSLAPLKTVNAADTVVPQPARTACPAGSLRYEEAEKNSEVTVTNIAECNIPWQHNDDSVTEVVQKVINTILGIIGMVSVIMLIIGGINFVISQGDTAKVTKARNTILYSIIGLVVSLLAFAIVNFVLNGVFNQTDATATYASGTITRHIG